MQPNSAPSDGTVPPRHRILYLANGGNLPISQDGLIFTLPFVQLTEDELARIAPDLVVFPLFTATLDATIVLTKLNALGYRGRCLILTPRLPKPKLIETELRAYSGAIQLELLPIDTPLE
ncbi:hypothetical protein GCM10010873_26100 [Cypionkella aquatica]|uniref:Uncharacterized protein n=1 Tax=Cypionkella aquatica TaxID=1756042 RepID=A0AA37X567_9RHOB|nr:hypothetical protein [Cypionkella aquatica]GLS87636.1 hypothetical protein GCM10010873_26100 [Cypionkella aquatica]